MVQVPLAGIVPPVRAIRGVPGSATSSPPHVVDAAGATATENPVPIVVSESKKLTIVAGAVVLFRRVMVSVVTCVRAAVAGTKFLLTAMGSVGTTEGETVSVAEAAG